jgi:hypothetical protein
MQQLFQPNLINWAVTARPPFASLEWWTANWNCAKLIREMDVQAIFLGIDRIKTLSLGLFELPNHRAPADNQRMADGPLSPERVHGGSPCEE